VFGVSYSFDELFGGASDLKFVPSASHSCGRVSPPCNRTPGPLKSSAVPAWPGTTGGERKVRGSWDYAAAAAGAVASRLAAWGVAPDRIRVLSLLDSHAAGAAPGLATQRVQSS